MLKEINVINMLIKLITVLIIIIKICFITGCSGYEGDVVQVNNKEIRVGVIPDQEEKALTEKYMPLFAYMSEKTGMIYKLVIPLNYEELLEWFINDKIDMALLGGYIYIKAHHTKKAVPLAVRDIDLQFSSIFLVNKRIKTKTIEELKDSVFSFGSALSTSGHVMPRYYLNNKNINPEAFFAEVRYSGAHDKTAEWVQDGVVDAGVVNANILYKMLDEGKIDIRNVRILCETPPYPDYVWAVQSGLSEYVKNKILNAFLGLSNDNKRHREILKRMGANYYLPANEETFKTLEKAIALLDLDE